jgi:hypothetical protein
MLSAENGIRNEKRASVRNPFWLVCRDTESAMRAGAEAGISGVCVWNWGRGSGVTDIA